jgi:4-hydroxy-tetrahydrodipicolinate reductase
MRIALIGYGNMGKTIEAIALSRGHEISLIYSLDDRPDHWQEKLATCDVAIEFTAPGAAVDHILTCFDAGVPVVVGTTGWYSHFGTVKQVCEEKSGGLFYASNFSIGVNLFFELNKQLASLMRRYPEYALEMEEIHHIHKKDAPSGTGITLAEGILEKNPAYTSWVNQATAASGQIPLISIREDEVPGTHAIRYTSEIDQIEIIHTAFNRKGFADGAVMAAEFMSGKKGIYTMSDLLQINHTHGN